MGELGRNPEDSNILLSEAYQVPVAQRENAAELLFEVSILPLCFLELEFRNFFFFIFHFIIILYYYIILYYIIILFNKVKWSSS
jgi:hypothetical protein